MRRLYVLLTITMALVTMLVGDFYHIESPSYGTYLFVETFNYTQNSVNIWSPDIVLWFNVENCRSRIETHRLFMARGGTVVFEIHGELPPFCGGGRLGATVKVGESAVRRVLERVGGRYVGTYLYNSTHLVTLVDAGFPDIYAAVWN
ncbi:MAG: hypothetical protein ACK4SY_10710, partial [Pyrobaculum sp.]